MPQTIDWVAIAPPLCLALTAIVVLLADAFVSAKRATRGAFLPATLTVAGLLVAVVLSSGLWDERHATFCVGAQSCSFVVDQLTLVFWGVVLFGTTVVALVATAAVRDGSTPPGEWNFLLLCSATGAMTIAASRDLITLVVALEVVSLPAFAMAGLRRGDPRAAESAIKFFLVSVISTAVMLMGVSLVYGATGSVFLGEIRAALSAETVLRDVAVAGALLTIVGLAFKVAAVPFHMWVPDTYVGAPVAVAAYLSVVSKAAGFVGLILVLGLGLAPLAEVWSPLVGVLAALTMTVGNVLALWQQHAIRLLAWSSVAQAGYILVPFAAAQSTGAATGAALGATMGYLAVYAFINLGAFAVAAVVGLQHPTQQVVDYRGLAWSRPSLGWPLAFALVALAGLPPGVVGLMAKVVVFDAAAGTATWLAVVMALNVAIGLVYYARWLFELFRPVEAPAAHRIPRGAGLAVALTFLAGLIFSVVPGVLLDPVLTAFGG